MVCCRQEFYGKDLAKYKLERAMEEFDTAELLFYNERYQAANNRAYYSIYYSITAVLCLEPIAFKKRKDTIGYFHKNYVHTSIFPKEIRRSISKAAKIRHASDYDDFYIAGKKKKKKQIQTAKELIGLVNNYISER